LGVADEEAAGDFSGEDPSGAGKFFKIFRFIPGRRKPNCQNLRVCGGPGLIRVCEPCDLILKEN
jgi:hypothetical protein